MCALDVFRFQADSYSFIASAILQSVIKIQVCSHFSAGRSLWNSSLVMFELFNVSLGRII